MYSASQIVIPPELPEVLKQFTKAAIKTQPDDLHKWAAEYFEALAKNSAPPASSRVAVQSDAATEEKSSASEPEGDSSFSIALLKQLKDSLTTDTISRQSLLSAADSLKYPQQYILDAMAVAEFEDDIPVAELLALQAAELQPGLKDTLMTLASVYGSDTSRLPLAVFTDALTFLAKLDDVPEASVAALLQTVQGQDDVNVSAVDFSSLVSEQPKVHLEVEGNHVDADVCL